MVSVVLGVGALLIGAVLLGAASYYCLSRWAGSAFARETAHFAVSAWLVRLVWLVVYFSFLFAHFPFAVTDDEHYHLLALGEEGVRPDNAYSMLLSLLYEALGPHTLNGRLLNVLLGALAVFPLAYLERTIVGRGSSVATRLYVWMPFQVFWTAFEVKDVLLLFLYMWAYALLRRLAVTGPRYPEVIAAIVVGLALEQLRTGMGALVATVAILQSVFRSGWRKGVGWRFLVIIGAVAVLVVHSETIGEYLVAVQDYVDDYQKWIFTQIDGSGLYSFLLVRGFSDLWKVPISIFVYVLQPVAGLYGTGRLFFDYGFLLRAADIGVNLFGFFGLFLYVRVERWRSLLFLVPLVFLAGINLTNSREGVFVFPLLYIAFALLWKAAAGDSGTVVVGVSSGDLVDVDTAGRPFRLLSHEVILVGCMLASIGVLVFALL